MKKFFWEKRKTKDIEEGVFFFFLLGMAVYYGWRIFALTPWYDELYTYYFFISRGPVYAAIHWPLPNNHVGYSVLSGFLDLLGNSAIGLRGVSWVSSLCSIALLYGIGRKCLKKGFAMVPVFLFCSMELVNQLAVQGRGYALATCLYLTAFYELVEICQEQKKQIKHYVIFSGALVWALYTLPSSVYFVIPLCGVGGIVLLMQKRTKEFLKLFVSAVISAMITVGLYAIIWLAIGSNLLAKTPDSGCYGQGHVSIILHMPFKALQTGIAYMLDTPYIQSVAREGYLLRFGNWIKTLFAYYYSKTSILLLGVVVVGILAVVWKLIRNREVRKQGLVEWYLLISFLLTPLMLIIQAALPYYRVFSYFGVVVAVLIAWLLMQIADRVRRPGLSYGVMLCTGAVCLTILCLPGSRVQYSDREAAIEDAFSHMVLENGESVCVTDCDQEYLMKYLLDTENVLYAPTDADYVLLDKVLLLSEEEFAQVDSADVWKFYQTPETVSELAIEQKMDVCYENDRFVLYQKKR